MDLVTLQIVMEHAKEAEEALPGKQETTELDMIKTKLIDVQLLIQRIAHEYASPVDEGEG